MAEFLSIIEMGLEVNNVKVPKELLLEMIDVKAVVSWNSL